MCVCVSEGRDLVVIDREIQKFSPDIHTLMEGWQVAAFIEKVTQTSIDGTNIHTSFVLTELDYMHKYFFPYGHLDIKKKIPLV